MTDDQRNGAVAASRYLTGSAAFPRYDRGRLADRDRSDRRDLPPPERRPPRRLRRPLRAGRAEAVLKFRALIDNGDFDAYWGFHPAREYQRVHPAFQREKYDLTA